MIGLKHYHALAHAFGTPTVTGIFKAQPQDFIVDEILGFAPSGDGEHLCLHIEKQGENTAYVARQIAKLAGCKEGQVAYPGSKDRHGVTRQWFSLPMPRKPVVWSELNTQQIQVLEVTRHRQKLATGCHLGNGFTITLREISDRAQLTARLANIQQFGVPNYFGEQRFGKNMGNLEGAKALFAGEVIRDRTTRSFYLSAARSWLFNHCVSERIKAGYFSQPYDFDALMLSQSGSFFLAQIDDEIRGRLARGELQLTAPLSGQGDDWLREERLWLEHHQADLAGLIKFGLKLERRAICLKPEALTSRWLDDATVEIKFMLPAGAFATAILRELLQYHEPKRVYQETELSPPVADKVDQVKPAVCANTHHSKPLAPLQPTMQIPMAVPVVSDESVNQLKDADLASHTGKTYSRQPDATKSQLTRSKQAMANTQRLRILLSNDDGVHALGMHTLYQYLSEFADVTVVGPDRNCSGASNSLTLINPLRTQQLANGFIAVNGTPTDCVHLALNQLLSTPPDLVVAGINHGANLGDDTLYSGTVAAATEGRHMGLPAVAVSLCSRKEDNFASAAYYAAQIIQQLASHPLPSDQILNINVPDLPLAEINGIQVTRLGRRHKAETMTKQTDPWGREVYWYGSLGPEQDAGPGTDFYAVKQGYVSVTPLTVDMTAYQSLSSMEKWIKALSFE